MPTVFFLTAAIVIPTVAGYTLMTVLLRRHATSFPLKLALAYGLGMGLLAIWMLLLGMLHLPFSVTTIGAPLIGLSLLCILYARRRHANEIPQEYLPQQSSAGETSLPPYVIFLHRTLLVLLSVYILHNLGYAFWRALNVPVSTWDAVSTVAFKAKIFYFEGSLPPLGPLPHRTYPLLTPFLQTWVALNLGHWDDQFIKIIFPFTLLSYLIIHYEFLKLTASRTWALLGSAMLFSSNLFFFHATIGYRDFLLMYYNCTTIILLLLWKRSKHPAFLALAAFFAGFATFTKLEGTAFLAIYLVLFLIMDCSEKSFALKQKITNALKFMIPSFGVGICFHVYKILNGVLKEGTGIIDKTGTAFSAEKLSALPVVIQSFLNNLLYSGNWNIVWLVLFLSLIHWTRKKDKGEVNLILLALVLFFGLYTAVALFTTNYAWIAGEEQATTLARLILHFYPLAVILIVLLNSAAEPLTTEKEQAP